MSIFEPTETGVATLTNKSSEISGVVVVVGYNFCCDARNGTPVANRTPEH